MGRKAIDAPGEAREDWWITKRKLVKRLGLEWNYKHPKDIFNEMSKAMPSLKNITWDRLDKEGSVTYPCNSPDSKGEEIVFWRQLSNS